MSAVAESKREVHEAFRAEGGRCVEPVIADQVRSTNCYLLDFVRRRALSSLARLSWPDYSADDGLRPPRHHAVVIGAEGNALGDANFRARPELRNLTQRDEWPGDSTDLGIARVLLAVADIHVEKRRPGPKVMLNPVIKIIGDAARAETFGRIACRECDRGRREIIYHAKFQCHVPVQIEVADSGCGRGNARLSRRRDKVKRRAHIKAHDTIEVVANHVVHIEDGAGRAAAAFERRIRVQPLVGLACKSSLRACANGAA